MCCALEFINHGTVIYFTGLVVKATRLSGFRVKVSKLKYLGECCITAHLRLKTV